jgi:hypothetical protein
MASVQPRRGGLRWVKSLTNPGLGTPPIVELVVASAYGTALFAGDALIAQTDGTVQAAVASGTISHVMVSASNYLAADSLTRPGAYLPASTTYTGTTSLTNPLASKILAIPVQDQVFEVDCTTGNATTTAGYALIGQCVDIVATAGSTANGQSGFTTDTVANFAATTVSAQLRLREIPGYGLDGTLNDVTATYWKGWYTVYEITSIL